MTKPSKVVLPRLATVKQYASYYQVDVRTVQRWVRDKAVPVRRVGPRKGVRVVVKPGDDATIDDI